MLYLFTIFFLSCWFHLDLINTGGFFGFFPPLCGHRLWVWRNWLWPGVHVLVCTQFMWVCRNWLWPGVHMVAYTVCGCVETGCDQVFRCLYVHSLWVWRNWLWPGVHVVVYTVCGCGETVFYCCWWCFIAMTTTKLPLVGWLKFFLIELNCDQVFMYLCVHSLWVWRNWL